MSLLGGLTSTLGGMWTNKQNQEFAEEMAGSQYQRAVADMKAAGLNPNAVFGSGGGGTGASSPQGQASNPVGDFANSAGNMVQLRSAWNESEKSAAEAEIAKSNADVITKENSAYKTALESDAGKAAATYKKYAGNGLPGWIGGAGAVAGMGANSPGFGGVASAKAGEMWQDAKAAFGYYDTPTSGKGTKK